MKIVQNTNIQYKHWNTIRKVALEILKYNNSISNTIEQVRKGELLR